MNARLLIAAVALLAGCKAASQPAENAQNAKSPPPATGNAARDFAKGVADARDSAAIEALLPAGLVLGPRADGDLNGDGRDDVAFVGMATEGSMLYVAAASKGPTGGYALIGRGPIAADEPDRLDISIEDGILVAEFENGGTTRTDATYRLRHDATARRMRLIGFDSTTYDRSLIHDTETLSWNLLTGAVVRSVSKPSMNGDDDPPAVETRAKHPTAPIMLETLPAPDQIKMMLAKRRNER